MTNETKNVRLVKVDTKNFDALIDLEVNEEQKNYVANNIYSLAEAYATKAEGRFALPLGIYDGETPVGFLMVGYDYPDFCDGEVPEYEKNSYLIWRFKGAVIMHLTEKRMCSEWSFFDTEKPAFYNRIVQV